MLRIFYESNKWSLLSLIKKDPNARHRHRQIKKTRNKTLDSQNPKCKKIKVRQLKQNTRVIQKLRRNQKAMWIKAGTHQEDAANLTMTDGKSKTNCAFMCCQNNRTIFVLTGKNSRECPLESEQQLRKSEKIWMHRLLSWCGTMWRHQSCKKKHPNLGNGTAWGACVCSSKYTGTDN